MFRQLERANKPIFSQDQGVLSLKLVVALDNVAKLSEWLKGREKPNFFWNVWHPDVLRNVIVETGQHFVTIPNVLSLLLQMYREAALEHQAADAGSVFQHLTLACARVCVSNPARILPSTSHQKILFSLTAQPPPPRLPVNSEWLRIVVEHDLLHTLACSLSVFENTYRSIHLRLLHLLQQNLFRMPLLHFSSDLIHLLCQRVEDPALEQVYLSQRTQCVEHLLQLLLDTQNSCLRTGLTRFSLHLEKALEQLPRSLLVPLSPSLIPYLIRCNDPLLWRKYWPITAATMTRRPLGDAFCLALNFRCFRSVGFIFFETSLLSGPPPDASAGDLLECIFTHQQLNQLFQVTPADCLPSFLLLPWGVRSPTFSPPPTFSDSSVSLDSPPPPLVDTSTILLEKYVAVFHSRHESIDQKTGPHIDPLSLLLMRRDLFQSLGPHQRHEFDFYFS